MIKLFSVKASARCSLLLCAALTPALRQEKQAKEAAAAAASGNKGPKQSAGELRVGKGASAAFCAAAAARHA